MVINPGDDAKHRNPFFFRQTIKNGPKSVFKTDSGGMTVDPNRTAFRGIKLARLFLRAQGKNRLRPETS